LIITYDDGSQEIIAFDPDTQVRHAPLAQPEPSPILEDYFEPSVALP
jgi:hypothetical protein